MTSRVISIKEDESLKVDFTPDKAHRYNIDRNGTAKTGHQTDARQEVKFDCKYFDSSLDVCEIVSIDFSKHTDYLKSVGATSVQVWGDTTGSSVDFTVKAIGDFGFVQSRQDLDAGPLAKLKAEVELGIKYKDSLGNIKEIDICVKPTASKPYSPVAFDLNDNEEIDVTGESTVKGHDFDEKAATVEFDIDNDGSGDTLNLSDLYASGQIVAGNLQYEPGDPEAGTVELTNGTIDTFSEIEKFICFTRGTIILTAEGEKAIETLAVGDKIVTQDNGIQELRWMGSRKVLAAGKMAPITIKAGAIGNDRDLQVSRQQRLLIKGWKAEMLFDKDEVLVAAKHLVNGDTIFVNEGGEVEYFLILFDTHEIVFANGAAAESCHSGAEAFGALAEGAREEVLTIFPELRNDVAIYGSTARVGLKGHEAKVLAENPDFLK